MEVTASSETATHGQIDWTDLPSDILFLIAQLMVYTKDYLSLSMVCKSWNSLLSKRSPHQFPMIMLPEELQLNDAQKTRRFYSLPASETYIFELPEASGRKCVPTSYGWLVTVGYDLQIHLLRPFTRQQIPLPPLLTFKDQYEYNDNFKPEEVVTFFVNKVTLSKDPRDEDCIAVAIYGQYRLLGFARPGDAEWMNIAVDSKCYEDVIYHKEMFYTVDCNAILSLCDIDHKNGPEIVNLAPAPDGIVLGTQLYLVESSAGDLLMVARFRTEIPPNSEDDIYRFLTTKFEIFKLEEYSHHQPAGSSYSYRWNRIKNLDGRALFLGMNVSKSLPPSEDVKPNCIYFAEFEQMYYDQAVGGGRDTGIFDIEKETIEAHYAANFHCHLSPPMWYLN